MEGTLPAQGFDNHMEEIKILQEIFRGCLWLHRSGHDLIEMLQFQRIGISECWPYLSPLKCIPLRFMEK
jgi:hypothetical protein